MPEQIVEFVSNLLLDKGLVLLIACFVIGQIIKKSFDTIPNKYIPAITCVCGSVLAVLTNKFVLGEQSLIMAALYGFIIGWATTGAYELFAKSEWFHKIFGPKQEENK